MEVGRADRDSSAFRFRQITIKCMHKTHSGTPYNGVCVEGFCRQINPQFADAVLADTFKNA